MELARGRFCTAHGKGFTSDNIRCDWWFLHAFDDRLAMIKHGSKVCVVMDAVMMPVEFFDLIPTPDRDSDAPCLHCGSAEHRKAHAVVSEIGEAE